MFSFNEHSFMVYGYFTRSLCGPRLDPQVTCSMQQVCLGLTVPPFQAYFVLFVLNPLLVDKLGVVPQGDWVPSLPRRFAQLVG